MRNYIPAGKYAAFFLDNESLIHFIFQCTNTACRFSLYHTAAYTTYEIAEFIVSRLNSQPQQPTSIPLAQAINFAPSMNEAPNMNSSQTQSMSTIISVAPAGLQVSRYIYCTRCVGQPKRAAKDCISQLCQQCCDKEYLDGCYQKGIRCKPHGNTPTQRTQPKLASLPASAVLPTQPLQVLPPAPIHRTNYKMNVGPLWLQEFNSAVMHRDTALDLKSM
ncbi:hypothetical protein M422DRAFT_45664 [Sphaerobolus stellatus SS14]|nr:hypothetical protein M422DRAFT_45664 [Sphaerobolus stellatus SS14]